jgi:hypothetical protein
MPGECDDEVIDACVTAAIKLFPNALLRRKDFGERRRPRRVRVASPPLPLAEGPGCT